MSGYNDFAYFYDGLFDIEEYEKRCRYIVGILKENGISDGILLDVACGTGTLSEMLSDEGFDVIGIDGSEDMLGVAMEKKAESGRNIQYLHQNMSEIDLFGTIKCAVCTLDSINHVTSPEEVERCFEKIGLFTEKDGIFIFDVNTEYKHREILKNNTFVYDTDEVFCVWQNELEEKTGSVHIFLDFFSPCGGDTYERYSEEFDEVLYSEKWLSDTLGKYGFEVTGIYDDLTKEPLRKDSERAVFVCRKTVETNGFFAEKE